MLEQCLWRLLYISDGFYNTVREAAKKIFFLVARPLGGGRVKTGPRRKKYFFVASLKCPYFITYKKTLLSFRPDDWSEFDFRKDLNIVSFV